MTGLPDLPTRTLVLGLVRADGTIHAGEAYRIGAAIGMTEIQVRLCFRRLIAHGLLARDRGRGHDTVLRYCGPADEEPLRELAFIRMARSQDAGLAPWDGLWRIVNFTIPEARRPVRDGLRDHLRFLGKAGLAPGVYVSPHDCVSLVEAEAMRLGALEDLSHAVCTRLVVRGVREPPACAARLWPLEEVSAAYDAFLTVHTPTADGASPAPGSGHGAEPMARVFRLAVDFARAAGDDPLLPPDLLPSGWPGPRARAVLDDPRSALREARQADDADNPLLLLAPAHPGDGPAP